MAKDTEKFRHLAAIILAEQAIEKATTKAFKAWLPTVVDAVLHGKTPDVQDPLQGEILLASVNPDMGEQTREAWATEVAVILLAIGRIFDAQFAGLGAKPTATTREAYLASVRSRLLAIPDEVFIRLREVVSTGIREGVTEEKLARRVHEALQPRLRVYVDRAKTIARTEAISVYNGGRHEAYLQLQREFGQKYTKTWMSVRDLRVRHTHAEANGQKVALAAKFNVGGFVADWPGDPLLPAAEAVNCRCVAIYAGTRGNGDAMTTPIVAYLWGPGGYDPADPNKVSEIVACIDEAYAADGRLPNGWRGPMAPLGRATGDGRQLNVPEAGVRTRELPITFDWAPSREGGHDGAVMAGRIDRAWIEGDMLWGEGAIDVGGYNGAEYARQLADGFAMFVSVDPDEVTFETQFFNAEGEQVPFNEAVMVGDGQETLKEGYTVLDVMTDWRLAGVTAVTIPAFQEARIEPVYDYKPRSAMAVQLDAGLPPMDELLDLLDAASDEDDLNELVRCMKRRRAYDILTDYQDEDGIVAAVTGSTGFPVFAERKRKWDGHGARQNVAKWASSDGSGDPDKINKKKFQSAFLWMGEPNTGNSLDGIKGFADKKTATWNVEDAKGGFVDIIDGKPYIVANAVIGLAGGHGVQAMSVPGPAKKAMLGKLKTLYGKMKKTFPDFPTFPFSLSEESGTMGEWHRHGSTDRTGQSFAGSPAKTAAGASRSTAELAVRPSAVSPVPGVRSSSTEARPGSGNTQKPSGSTVVATVPSAGNGSRLSPRSTNSLCDSGSTESIKISSYACGDLVVESVGPDSSASPTVTSTMTMSPASSGASSVLATTSGSASSETTSICSCGQSSTFADLESELVAGAAGQVFDLASFEDPKLSGPTPLTVKDGKVYGHVALFESCYMAQGGARSCIKPPKGGDYSRFLTHGARLTDGEVLPVGMITFGEGHFAGGSLRASMANYANLATGAAKVNVGEDEFGVWVSGEVIAAFADRADDLLLSPLSGHWEPDLDRGGALTLIAAHVVVTPGFHVPRLVATMGTEGALDMAIIAAPFTFLEKSAELFDAAVETGEIEVVGEREDGVVLYDEVVVAAVQADRKAQRALVKLGVDPDSRATVALQRLGVRS